MGDENPSDEHITMLMGMGFSDIEFIRKALSMAKNDLNEAVAILTGEDSRGCKLNTSDVEMIDSPNNGNASNGNNNYVHFGPHQENLQIVLAENSNEDLENINITLEEIPDEFPVTNLYELEDRVFTERWSIPYKKNESLAKCLYGALKLAHAQKTESDENCVKFMNNVLPESMNKLLCSQAVKKWTAETLEGVFNMLQLFADVMANRLKYFPTPVKLLDSLASAFDPESEFHYKNRAYKWDRCYYEDLFGYEKCPAMSPPVNMYKEPYGWLVNLVNRFAYKGGIDAIIWQISKIEKPTPSILACLLKPFGLCSAYLNQEVLGHHLGGAADNVVQFIQTLKADDMKEKEVDKVYDLLRILHAICEALWPDKTSAVEELHLDTILKMLALPHFNARMNAVKELSRLIREIEKDHMTRNAQCEIILKWLLENKVLSVAFSSSLHHAQYCEKLKKIVEFAGAKISLDELTTIWEMQTEKHVTVIDNIHSIIASLAQSCSTQQLDHLISLFQKSWNADDDKSKERLLLLIGKIGCEIKDSKSILQLLDMLWKFAHVENLPVYLLNQAVQSHIDILTESMYVLTSVKYDYVKKCVQDIQVGNWVVPAIRHILHNLRSTTKSPTSKDVRAAISQLQEQHSLLKLLTHSLINCHKKVTSDIPSQSLSGDTLIDNMYTYAETVVTHLKLIEFLLQDGGLYLSWSRCKDIWDCLMLDNQNCEGDYETCFEWFLNCIADLNPETQRDLFISKILKADMDRIKETGLKCFKSYFESVNIHEHRIHKNGPTLVIDKQDLTGISYLWQLVLESSHQDIAENAAIYLINVSFKWLTPKLKKNEPTSIHKRFMGDCCKRLDQLLQKLNTNDETGSKEVKIAKTFKKPLPIKGSVVDRGKLLTSVERLLKLAYLYITTVEESYTLSRNYPPHGACFHGFPITLHIICELNKTEFDITTHSNESLKSLRQKIHTKINTLTPDQLQIYKSEMLLVPAKDHNLLCDLEIEDKQTVTVKAALLGTAVGGNNTNEEIVCINGQQHELFFQQQGIPYCCISKQISSSTKRSALLEREKSLPSFLLAVEYKVFDKLYQLAELEESQITNALQNLLLHLPTDGDVLQAIDVFSFQNPLSSSPGTRAGYTKNSTSVLENYFKCSAPKMSATRVLYNLQVLSSKLMPVVGGESSAITHSFRENWLNAGGLPLIMNILLPDTLPKNADYELRQSCYYIILQLAKLLLCGDSYESSLINIPPIRTFGQVTQEQFTSADSSYNMSTQADVMDVSLKSSTPVKFPPSPVASAESSVASSWPGVRNGSSPTPIAQTASSPNSIASYTPENGSRRKRLRSASIIESISPTVRIAVENLNEMEYSATISSLLQVSWAAASGQLQLNASSPKKASESTDSVFTEELKGGICLHQESISDMDAVLANNGLELLVMCLQLRSKLMNMFYNSPNIKEFIIDVLTGSPSRQVRTAASTHFAILASTQNDEIVEQQPKPFLLNVLMKAPLPVWSVSGTARGSSFKVIRQCQEYFELLCNIFYMLSKEEQKELGVSVEKLLDDELDFLTQADNISVELLTGHLKFTNALFTCEGVDKAEYGHEFIQMLLDEFLFGASKSTDLNISSFNSLDFDLNAFNCECRSAAFNLLLTLADRCPSNLVDIADQLTSRHHNKLNSKLWNFQSPVSSRPCNGFVGLKNAGATCYMNSVIQQLYMLPGLKEALLKIEDIDSPPNILHHVQTIFGQLWESQTQFYTPETFWESFRFWGEPVNLREQHDAFEFFINFTDQIDEKLKSLKKQELFKRTFCGVFVDQKICKECTHTFERDDDFFSLPVTVKCGSLESSLEQFVHTEIMEGDNAYFCEKCNERRTTLKRTCIKRLPPVLTIQLKRFYYDWERSRAIKFNDFFTFPWMLDVEPYTFDGITKAEKDKDKDDSGEKFSKNTIVTDMSRYYELVGVIVHIGQANAGHYYSYIKNRQGSTGEFNKWYKFNDISVDRFDMSDQNLETECFGGDYKVPQSTNNSQYPENRIRNWNAYMLFYETMDKTKLLPSNSFQDTRGSLMDLMRSYPGSPASSTSSNPPSPGSKDTLGQLSALIRKGERKGLFNDNMPSNIKRMVNESNLLFMRNRDLFNEEYFSFIRQLISSNKFTSVEATTKNPFVCCLKLAVHFLFNTYFNSAKSLRAELDLWITNIEFLISQNEASCTWLLDFMANASATEYILPFLLECPDKSIREAFSKLLYILFRYSYKYFGPKINSSLDKIVDSILSLLSKDVAANIKSVDQYFTLIYKYALLEFFWDQNSLSIVHPVVGPAPHVTADIVDDSVKKIKSGKVSVPTGVVIEMLIAGGEGDFASQHLSKKKCFSQLYNFLLGSQQVQEAEKLVFRRWTAMQTQELTSLHKTMVLLIINTDNSILKTASTGDMLSLSHHGEICQFPDLLQMTSEIEEYWYKEKGERYMHECLFACVELPQISVWICDVILYSCWCDLQFSVRFFRQMMSFLEKVEVNDIKRLFDIITNVLELPDPHQNSRIEICIDGSTEHGITGLLSLIDSSHNEDGRRAYQFIKFLVTLGNKISQAKEYLVQSTTKWQWAIDWLKQKMSADYSQWTSSQSNVTKDGETPFQRTVSAQNTLAEATKLLTEYETRNLAKKTVQSELNMETCEIIEEETTE